MGEERTDHQAQLASLSPDEEADPPKKNAPPLGSASNSSPEDQRCSLAAFVMMHEPISENASHSISSSTLATIDSVPKQCGPCVDIVIEVAAGGGIGRARVWLAVGANSVNRSRGGDGLQSKVEGGDSEGVEP